VTAVRPAVEVESRKRCRGIQISLVHPGACQGREGLGQGDRLAVA
jgi:hypothetical protein